MSGGHAGVGVISLGGASLVAHVMCVGQPLLTVNDLIADPGVMSCLAK